MIDNNIKWRKIEEKEREYLLRYYKGGAMVFKFMMGIWLCFGGLISCAIIYSFISEITNGNLLNAFGCIIGGAFFGGLTIFLPIFIIKNMGKAEVEALNSEKTLICEGKLVKFRKVFKARGVTHYVAGIEVFDEFNNTHYVYDCRYLGTIPQFDKLPIGEEMLIIKLLDGDDELTTIERKVI